MREDEREFLEPWLDGFERAHGVRPQLRRLDKPTANAPDDLWSVTFPMVFQSSEDIGQAATFRHMPRMVEHVRRMGFDWDAQGRILTIPTPCTYNALLPIVAGPDCGYEAFYVREDVPMISLGPWLRAYAAGRQPLHVGSSAFYRQPYQTPNEGPIKNFSEPSLRWHVTAFMHDVSVHLLNYHLVPRRCILDIGRRIREAMADRFEGWSAPRSMAPFTLTWFFDFDINSYCYGVWCRAEGPERFGPIFAAESNYSQLLAALQQRIEEVKDGTTDALVPYMNMMGTKLRQEFCVR
jgi:hypothetical protein